MADEQAVSFEDSIAELEQILRSLEDGSTTLDESIQEYERGIRLIRICQKTLVDAELRIQELTVDMNGNMKTKKFEHSTSEAEEPGNAKKRADRKNDGFQY